MGFTKSVHSVIGYERAFSPTLRLKSEIYYQYLFEIPVEVRPSAFSLTNMGSGFSRFFPNQLQNTGTANNYGLELTLEKFFNKTFFFLISAAFFDAKYKGSDGVLRNTDFNGKYAANFLMGKEFQIKKKSTLGLSTKITTTGGRWYGIADTVQSLIQRELVFLDSAYNSLQFRPYFRADLRVNYRINAKKVTHEIALDLVNIFNTKNILGLTYSPNPLNPASNPIRENYQLGFLPLFYYRLDF
jgi:outer membrane receptor protein involved in Fe transport